MRLDKFLAHHGIGTRREVNQMIRQNRVKVNGVLRRSGGYQLQLTDTVQLDEQFLKALESVTIAFHKPRGLVTATTDAQQTIYSLLPFSPQRVKYAGRLDKDSEGLLILTDDGQLNHRIISPRWHLEKEYLVTLDHEIADKDLAKFQKPLRLEDGTTVRPAIVCTKLEPGAIRLVIDEGKYHQVRRMCAAVGYRVIRLVRTRIGAVQLGELEPGEYRKLTQQELLELKKF